MKATATSSTAADFKGLSIQDRPQILSVSVNYTMPAYGFAEKNVVTRTLLAGWTIGTVSQYSSGTLLAAPASNNGIGTYLPGSSSRAIPRARPIAVPQGHQLRLLRSDAGDGAESGRLERPGARRVRQRDGLLFGLPRPAPARWNRSTSGKRFPIRERMALSLRVRGLQSAQSARSAFGAVDRQSCDGTHPFSGRLTDRWVRLRELHGDHFE